MKLTTPLIVQMADTFVLGLFNTSIYTASFFKQLQIALYVI